MTKTKPLALTVDSERIRTKIEQRLAELGKTARGASREAKLSDSAIRNIMEGRSRSPRLETVMSLARVLKVEPDWFLDSAVSPDDPTEMPRQRRVAEFLLDHSDQIRRESFADLVATEFVYLALPIITKSGEYLFKKDKYAYLHNNTSFVYANNQYGIIVRNDAMRPLYKSEDIVICDKTSGDFVEDEDYFFIRNDDVEGCQVGKLARLVSASDQAFRVRVFNPEADENLPRDVWIECHRVLHRFPGGI